MSITHHAQILFAHSVVDTDVKHFTTGVHVLEQSYEKFGIAEAQSLVKAAHVRPGSHDTQLCIIRTQFVTLEAQNALLKVFEEPPESTTFLLVVPREFTVISTLMSRCVVVDTTETTVVNTQFQEFLAGSYAERLALIDTAQKKKDASWQRSIKSGLIEYVQTHAENVKELEYSARLLLTRGASNKFLLEHVALTIPATSRV